MSSQIDTNNRFSVLISSISSPSKKENLFRNERKQEDENSQEDPYDEVIFEQIQVKEDDESSFAKEGGFFELKNNCAAKLSESFLGSESNQKELEQQKIE